jgi:hypothetical protein
MMNKIMILGAALGIFVICAIIVMFVARHEKARSELCMQCHPVKTTNEPQNKTNMKRAATAKSLSGLSIFVDKVQ